MMSDEKIAFDLSCASELDLINELIRRTICTDRRALILGVVRPAQEGNAQEDELVLQVRGTDPLRMQWLMAHFIKAAGVQGRPEGSIDIPRPTSLGDESPPYGHDTLGE